MMRRLVEQPDVASDEDTDRLLPLLLVWHVPGKPDATPASLSFIGRGMTPVALFRSSWDAQATFAGIKGGQASSPHGHMDVGTFVIDMLGERFVEDLGMQDYNSLESLGLQIWDRQATSDRWKVFRLHARSHNVLSIDGKDHRVDGRGDFVATTPASVRIDMAGVYQGQLANASRELRLREDRGVEVRDEVTATDSGAVVRWQIITGGTVALAGERATLTVGGKRAALRIAGIDGVVLQSRPVDPPPAAHDAPNPGKSVVWFEARLKPGERQALDRRVHPDARGQVRRRARLHVGPVGARHHRGVLFGSVEGRTLGRGAPRRHVHGGGHPGQGVRRRRSARCSSSPTSLRHRCSASTSSGPCSGAWAFRSAPGSSWAGGC